MKTLILMRHAKSSWSSSAMEDHERPLNQRGKQSAAALGTWLQKWLLEKKLNLKQAIVSSSLRTQEMFKKLELQITPTLSPAIYHASSDTLLETIENAKADTTLIIGHNPGIGELAFRFARMMRNFPPHPRFRDFPTGATLIIQWNSKSWHDIDWSQGEIIEFITPKDII